MATDQAARDTRSHVMIVGGGFGGLAAAKALRDAPVRVTIVDRHNYHLFQPLLYQVATGALNASDIAQPIRRILRKQKNASVIMGDAIAVAPAARKVVFPGGELAFDYLVVATGATHSYFGHDAWERCAPGLKTVEDAIDIRRRVLVAFEAAERDPELQAEWLTFVIVGAGPTGVELAGALAEISNRVVSRDFRRIDPRTSRIVLIEASARVLPMMSPESSESARRALERLGVEIVTGAAVTGIDEASVTSAAGRIRARTVLWAAGVAASPIARSLGVPLDRAGRVPVEPDLSLSGAPHIYVIGDLAQFLQDGKQVPGVATAAMQEGRHAARNIIRTIRGDKTEPFHYVDKGTLATIGRAAAVIDYGRIHASGLLAWVLWLVVHIVYLVGFRNRVLVLIEWAWVYLRNERGARLITGDVEPLLERGEHHLGQELGSEEARQ